MTVVGPVVLDNTVLTNFALAERTDLVMQLWGTALCTTARVMSEYQHGIDQGSVPGGTWQDLPTIELEREEESLCEGLPSSLGPGERSCIAVASRRTGTLATDDLLARKAAAKQGVAVTGTVGILIGCIRRGLIDLSEGNQLLEVMIGHSYHSPVRSLDDFL